MLYICIIIYIIHIIIHIYNIHTCIFFKGFSIFLHAHRVCCACVFVFSDVFARTQGLLPKVEFSFFEYLRISII